jgi:hypothetical protein
MEMNKYFIRLLCGHSMVVLLLKRGEKHYCVKCAKLVDRDMSFRAESEILEEI